jgi:hypothetical protein
LTLPNKELLDCHNEEEMGVFVHGQVLPVAVEKREFLEQQMPELDILLVSKKEKLIVEGVKMN